MSTSYASDCKELLNIPFEKFRGRHDSEIHLGKQWWEFTGVPHHAKRMIGGRAPHVSVSVGRRPSHRGKATVEEDGPGVSESVQRESSHPSTGGAGRSSGDAERVEHDTPNLGDGSAFSDEDTVPPQLYLTDEEWREQERERIRDAHERAMIEDELKAVRLLGASGMGPAIVDWLHHHLCSVARGACFLGGYSIFLQVWAWEHITIHRPLPGQSMPSFPMIHCWSYEVWDSERIPLRLYYSLFLDTQVVRELGLPQTSHEITSPWTPIMASTTDEGAYLREMAPWIEEWRTIEERDSIAEDFEHLRQNFDWVVAGCDFMRDELERVRAELERVQSNSATDECHEHKEDVKGLMDRCGRLSGLLLATGGNPSLADVNPYVRVPLPSSVRSQSQSWVYTQMTRGPRQVRLRLEGEASSRTAAVEYDSVSK
ncbi:hypothetical protein AMTR_s00118p00101010, partial [Amborella trichopoda]